MNLKCIKKIIKLCLPYGLVVLIQRTKQRFPGTAAFWEDRYASGGSSGSGSYYHLAKFKADVLNNFVQTNGIKTVMEFGCGDGNQLSLINYPQYIGFDISATVIDMCKKRFENDATKEFYLIGDYSGQTAQLVLSLDVIYHLIEDALYFAYMDRLFNASTNYVIIYANNEDRKATFHVRPRKFTKYIEKNQNDWKLIDHIPNKYPYDKTRQKETSWSEFYIYKKGNT